MAEPPQENTSHTLLRDLIFDAYANIIIAIDGISFTESDVLRSNHERKKMYWEQLELRCRSLYRPPSAQAAAAAAAPPQHQTNCSCCAQCHINEPAWDISLQHRFWAPGRMGNLYSPNPGTTRKTSAWSWFPWPRNTAQKGPATKLKNHWRYRDRDDTMTGDEITADTSPSVDIKKLGIHSMSTWMEPWAKSSYLKICFSTIRDLIRALHETNVEIITALIVILLTSWKGHRRWWVALIVIFGHTGRIAEVPLNTDKSSPAVFSCFFQVGGGGLLSSSIFLVLLLCVLSYTVKPGSRCRMGGVPQSGDSAYGFCDADNPQSQQRPANQNAPYEDAAYPNGNAFNQNAYRSQNFPQSGQNVPQGINFGQSASNFAQNQAGFAQEAGFGESSGTFNAQTGVWGPPPPYSPQARNGSRHHLHQDPTSASFLHHHHIDIHRNSMPVHHDPNLGSNMAIQSHTCRNSSYIGHMMHPNIPEMAHMDPSMARVVNPDMVRLNPEMVRLNPEMARLNPEMARLNPEMARLNPEMARLNPALYPADVNEMARLQEMSRLGNESGRFNTLRGHLVQYPDCQRQLNISMGNIHRDCRMQDDNITIECLHQKNGSKVSDHSSSDSCKKQGKENLAFQNDKHSPIRSSMQDCQRGGSTSNQNAESEVYFADVSSCCNVSLKVGP
ncbi:hypothetical protein EVAR_94601_1 [Eumeta japonica]|uniref:Uncharacterized protein n=1 Tax=Eumeta variegata TaxID=151549 RepID=A0A4C1UTH0_EUMVA|nr:hypothetical protein EVAR_94601_1 [Eumeta japonica]